MNKTFNYKTTPSYQKDLDIDQSKKVTQWSDGNTYHCY